MGRLLGCRFCKGSHRKRSAFMRCKRIHGPKQFWS